MNNKKSTKRALLSSVLSLVLCMAMLIGTTFAWFTDNVSSKNNIIKSGNLDVEMEYYDGDSWEKVTADTNVFEENTLWEPGHTEVVYLKVSNLGTLALKYNLGINIVNEIESINVAGEALRLSDYIKFGAIEDVETPYADRAAARTAVTESKILSTGYTKAGSIEAGAAADYVALVVYMPETVGNEANYRTGEVAPEITLGLNLMATQYTSEKDSFDNQYDANATFGAKKVADAATLADAIANGGNIVFDAPIDISKIDLTTTDEDIAIDAAFNKITTTDVYGVEVTPGKNVTISNGDIVMTKEGDYINYAAGFRIANGDYAGATITLKNCKISMANGDWSYAVNMPASVKNLNLVIDNCVLEGAIAVQCWGDNNNIKITNSKLICSYTTNAAYTSTCVALQGEGANVSENNTLIIDNCEFSYNGIDNFNSPIGSVWNKGTNNTVTVTNCTYGAKITE